MDSKKISLPPIYQSAEVLYRRNVQRFLLDKKTKRFEPRNLDLQKSERKITEIELEEILGELEALAVHHGCCYRIVNGASIAIFFGVLTLIGFIVLGVLWIAKFQIPIWLLVLVLVIPLFLGVVLFSLVCNRKRRMRKERLYQSYDNFKEAIDHLNKVYAQKRIIFHFDDSTAVLELDYQTNDPIKRMQDKASATQTKTTKTSTKDDSVLLKTPQSPQIEQNQLSPMIPAIPMTTYEVRQSPGIYQYNTERPAPFYTSHSEAKSSEIYNSSYFMNKFVSNGRPPEVHPIEPQVVVYNLDISLFEKSNVQFENEKGREQPSYYADLY